MTIKVPASLYDLTYTKDYSKLNALRMVMDVKGDFQICGGKKAAWSQ